MGTFFQHTSTAPRTITVQELHRQLRCGAALTVIDVRSADEFARDGHVEGARLLPLPVLAMRAGELPTDTPIVCICRSGNRSGAACDMLAQMGFLHVTNVTGGMLAWQRAGLPQRGGDQ